MNPDSGQQPPPCGRREQQRRERERTILHAAIELFAERAPEEVSMEEIARRADVATGTLYTYFPNKEELFEAAARRLFLQIKPEVLMALGRQDQSPLARIESYLIILHEHIERHLTFFQTIHRLGISSCSNSDQPNPPQETEEESCAKVILDMNLALSACISEGQERGEIRTDLHAEIMAASLRGLGRGLTEWRHEQQIPSSIADHATLIFDFFVRGASPAAR